MYFETDWGALESLPAPLPALMPGNDDEAPLGLDCALFDELCMTIRTMTAAERLSFIDRMETEAALPYGFMHTAESALDIELP